MHQELGYDIANMSIFPTLKQSNDAQLSIYCSISRRLRHQGKQQRDKRAGLSSDFHRQWRDLRRIRATFPTCTQTLYRLKSNSFPLWNWAAQNLSCPQSECVRGQSATASHVFWSCPVAQRHWEKLFSLWQCIGMFEETDKHVWSLAWSFRAFRALLKS
ncbi:unnamed protein product [Peronospora belbahrii]|uniref:Reverse transcriptase zinc-binding domain-containing protein n=1 Tax=Peronospora belbahrii TaxID=622444 RepID=A0AAU9KVY9_9STRA|nr:unnamed protein product [Peronospora belbahrii]CAH0515700.1 unnamed protein product [Peronospora belbahrii]